jgi:hypothetical protein
MISTCILQICGSTVFATNRPDPYPNIFGYHEIFHMFVISAGVCVYICNWSIIRRTCQPYANPNVIEMYDILYIINRILNRN